MNNLDTLTTFIGWCTVINMGLLAVSTLAVITGQKTFSSIHARLFKLPASDLGGLYFSYIAGFKLLVIIFNLTPYIALRLMA